MKRFIVCLFFLTSSAVASGPNCGPDSKFSNRQDLGVDIALFREPGVWYNGDYTHMFSEHSDEDAICRYLGMKTAVATTKQRYQTSFKPHIVTLDAQNKWTIRSSGATEVIISAIHCQ